MDQPSGIGESLQSRIQVLRFAAYHFIDVIREFNAVGIVSFNDEADEDMPVTHINTIYPTDDARMDAKAIIGN
jgi:hypothetical protein